MLVLTSAKRSRFDAIALFNHQHEMADSLSNDSSGNAGVKNHTSNSNNNFIVLTAAGGKESGRQAYRNAFSEDHLSTTQIKQN